MTQKLRKRQKEGELFVLQSTVTIATITQILLSSGFQRISKGTYHFVLQIICNKLHHKPLSTKDIIIYLLNISGADSGLLIQGEQTLMATHVNSCTKII